MALVRLTTGKNLELAPERAHELWKVLTGEIDGTDEQQDFAMTVKKIYLNWRSLDCPESYIRDHFDVIAPMAINGWRVDSRAIEGSNKHASNGVPAGPDPARPNDVAFAEKYGLTKNGRVTDLARGYFHA